MRYATRMSGIKVSAIREAGQKIASRRGCISFAQGLPDPALFPAEEIRKATDRILSKKPEIALQYGSTRGYDPLLEKIARDMNARGIRCNKDNLQITSGSQQGISMISMLFLDPGDAVITEEPTYLGALNAFRPFECTFKGVRTDDDGMNMEALEEVLKNTPKAKLIYIVPNFSNPSGITMSASKRKRLVKLADQYDITVIEDNPYGDIRFDGEPLPSIKSLDQNDRVIYLGSYSKILCPGLRAGWMCGNEELLEKVEMLRQGVDLQSNQLAQMQIDEYINENDIEEQIRRIIRAYREKRDLMVREIEGCFPESIKYVKPEGGMFLWLELPKRIDAGIMLDKALENGVGYVPGGPFFPEGGGENTIRLNFSTVGHDEIKKGISKLAETVSGALEGYSMI